MICSVGKNKSEYVFVSDQNFPSARAFFVRVGMVSAFERKSSSKKMSKRSGWAERVYLDKGSSGRKDLCKEMF